jgi:hypothetical protein
MPMMYKASHAGMDVLRYLNDPMSMNSEAEPINEIPRDIKTLVTMLTMISFLSRFLTVASASFIYALRMAFISFRIAPTISLRDIFSDI